MALTHEDLTQLKAWFDVSDHEFLQGNAYITEDSITERIESIDPAWHFEIMGITTRDNAGQGGKDVYTVIVHAAMTIKGATRHNTGMAVVQRSNEIQEKVWNDKTKKKEPTGETYTIEANEGEKSATTDALKRCARLFGIGRYLLALGKDVKDYNSLARWFTDNAPKEKTWLDDESQVAQVKLNLVSMIETYNEASVNQAKADLNPRQFTSAMDYLESLSVLADGIYSPEPQTSAPAANVTKPDFTPPAATGETEANDGAFKKALWDATDFMYDNDTHKRNSLKLRMADDATQHRVTADMPLDKAVLEVMKHRALMDLFIGSDDYFKVFNMAIETYVQSHGLERTWQRFNAYFAEQQPPAKPKAQAS